MASTLSLVISESHRKSQRKSRSLVTAVDTRALVPAQTYSGFGLIYYPTRRITKTRTHSGHTTCEGSTLRHITALNHFSKHTAHTCQILGVADRNVFILLLQADESWRCVNKYVFLYFPSENPDRSFRGPAWPVSSSNYAFWNSHKKQKHRPVRAHSHVQTGWQE